MDTFTHAFVPYVLFAMAGRSRMERTAAAVGGMAPDLDAAWAWLSHVHPYAYPLVHRGFSHSLIGAPLVAVLLQWILTRTPWARSRWLADVWLRRSTLLPLTVGAWSHLALDSITITGVPLLWPFSLERFGPEWFFFAVPYLLPISAIGILVAVRRPDRERFVRGCFVVLVLTLLAAGAVRWYTYPDYVEPGDDVTPGSVEWRWFVSRPQGATVLVFENYMGDEPIGPQTFKTTFYAETADIRARCEQTIGYIPWKWQLWGVPVVRADQVIDGPNGTMWRGGLHYDGPAYQNGTWVLEYYDSAVLYDERHPVWRPWSNPGRYEYDEPGWCVVTPDGHAEFGRPRGWLGS